MSDELPEWVQVLVNAAKDEAYWLGWNEGRRHLWEEWQKKTESWSL